MHEDCERRDLARAVSDHRSRRPGEFHTSRQTEERSNRAFLIEDRARSRLGECTDAARVPAKFVNMTPQGLIIAFKVPIAP
jgi:hypothetical protein